ncbi:MAG: class I SAM-dependent methyltransferase, partial [Anaerolineales bacterium]
NIERVRQRLNQLDAADIHDVLELGCGIGAVSAYLSKQYGMNVTGTDFDPQQIEIARQLYSEGKRLRFQVEDATNLNFDDESFDLVISQNVFHHIPAWDKAIHEVARVLREAGYIIWLDLAFPAIIKKLLRPWVKNYGLYTIDDVNIEFDRNGFNRLFYEKSFHGFFMHHHLVLTNGK